MRVLRRRIHEWAEGWVNGWARERARGECGFMKLIKLKKGGGISDVFYFAVKRFFFIFMM
jgi:hypothetical protein